MRNAGRKTTIELEELCQWLLLQPDSGLAETLPLTEHAQHLVRIEAIAPSNLSLRQLDLLNNYVRQWHTALSVRSQTALNNLALGNLDYPALHHFFFEKQIQVDQIRNVGKKSLAEIEALLERLRAKVEEVKQQSDESLEADLAVDQLCQAFSLTYDLIEPYWPNIRDEKFPLWRFLQNLILNHHIFDKKQAHILRARSGWFRSDEVIRLDIIGDQIGLSRERTRQIANKVEEKFLEKIAFFNTQKTALLHITGGGYGLDTNRDILLMADDINHIEGTDFTTRFFAVVFAALHADTHTLFGKQFDFFQDEYLLRSDLLEGFDAEAFVSDMESMTGERIKEDFSLDLEGYLLKFLRPDQPTTMLERARNVSADLLMLEFLDKVRLELPNELIICRNTKQQVWEYAFEALETIGTPAKLDVIYQAVVEKHPDFESNIEALRGTLTKEKSHFISFSRTSTFGLARWETEREDIRGGTIRDIAEEYLQQFSEPKHYYDITDFVLRYRPSTSPRSVHGNLQADESGRFIEFLSGFWGLAERNYGDFQTQPMSNHALDHLKAWLTAYPDGIVEEAIEHLSQKCQVQPVQIRSWLAEKERSGTLRLEQDKLTIIR